MGNFCSWDGGSQAFAKAVWNKKVEELAKRGFELGQLLEFYVHLGSVMPHFDPRSSTTNDVVRQVIIPRSAPKKRIHGTAYAVLMQENSGPVSPAVMVSHNWDNLFAHLVAAIVADALGKKEYGTIVERLTPGRLPSLRAELELKSRTKLIYWVCALSVNQHGNICGGFGSEPERGTLLFEEYDLKRRDNVTGTIYPVCQCRTPKHFNDHWELCELNKFDDMMCHLSHCIQGFRQIVAVDANCQVFSRAWVVAEIVEARRLKMKQDLKVFSSDAVDVIRKLGDIDVRNCSASRPEDKDEILSKIDDVDTFNQDLNKLLFHRSTQSTASHARKTGHRCFGCLVTLILAFLLGGRAYYVDLKQQLVEQQQLALTSCTKVSLDTGYNGIIAGSNFGSNIQQDKVEQATEEEARLKAEAAEEEARLKAKREAIAKAMEEAKREAAEEASTRAQEDFLLVEVLARLSRLFLAYTQWILVLVLLICVPVLFRIATSILSRCPRRRPSESLMHDGEHDDMSMGLLEKLELEFGHER